MIRRPLLLALSLSLTASCFPVAKWFLELPDARFEGVDVQEIMVPMRDGAKLATDVYLPTNPVQNFDASLGGSAPSSRRPTIFVRTPYSKSGVPLFLEYAGRFFARYGYAVVMQDVRGRFKSEGDWYPLLHELEDGEDATKWIVSQPWSNGSIGMLGASYLTVTSWLVADRFPDAVKAMVLAVGSLDPYIVAYERGMLRYDVVGSWILAMHGKKLTVWDVRKFEDFARHLPPSKADDATVGPVPFYDDFLQHPGRDAFWERHPSGVAARSNMPVLMITGWYDFFIRSQLADFRALGNREHSKLLVGPWTHIGGTFEDPDISYGPDSSSHPAVRWILDFFDQHLMGQTPRYEWGPVRTFAVGENRWVDTPSWPPPNAGPVEFFLGGRGDARACRNGALLTRAEENSPPDSYTYNPENPVPTVGGSLLAWVMGVRGYPPNAKDQSRLCSRKDIVSYLTEPFKQPLRLAGPMEARLWVSSTADDTAFTAKLVDVSPIGPPVNIQDGIATLAFRSSDRDPVRTEPGTVVEVVIDLKDTHWAIQAGHQLRLDVSSSNFPQFHRHPNRFGPFADVDEFVTARQTLYHDATHPSRIVLTVLP